MFGKASLAILTAFIISFSVLSMTLFLYHYKLEDGKWVLNPVDRLSIQKAYLQNFPLNQKKIFLIGSSQVAPLNPNYIHEDLLKNNLNYTVYNLQVPADYPKYRVKVIDSIISAKPAMVVYGIGDREFSIVDSSISDQNQPNLLPNIHDMVRDVIQIELNNSQDNFYFLESPKLDFLNFVFGRSYTHEVVGIPFYNNPSGYAEHFEKGTWPVATDSALEAESKVNGLIPMLPLAKNENLIAFKKIVRELHDNKIQVIIFVLPQEIHRLKRMPVVEPMDLVLRNISQEFPGVPIYTLWDKYADLHIWQDVQHVVMNSKKTTRIYSDDIARMILQEIPPEVKKPHGFNNVTSSVPKFNYKLEPYREGI